MAKRDSHFLLAVPVLGQILVAAKNGGAAKKALVGGIVVTELTAQQALRYCSGGGAIMPETVPSAPVQLPVPEPVAVAAVTALDPGTPLIPQDTSAPGFEPTQHPVNPWPLSPAAPVPTVAVPAPIVQEPAPAAPQPAQGAGFILAGVEHPPAVPVVPAPPPVQSAAPSGFDLLL